jgi:hypothetical protein
MNDVGVTLTLVFSLASFPVKKVLFRAASASRLSSSSEPTGPPYLYMRNCRFKECLFPSVTGDGAEGPGMILILALFT